MTYRHLFALAVTLCGCVHQQKVSSEASARAEFPAEERILAENFLKALYRPNKTQFSIVIDPDVNRFSYGGSPRFARQLKAQLQERLHGFQMARGDITFAMTSHSSELVYGRFVRGSGNIEYFPAEPEEKPDVFLEMSPKSINATISKPSRYQLTSNLFEIRPDDKRFHFVLWAPPTLY